MIDLIELFKEMIMSFMRVFAMLLMLITFAASAVTCSMVPDGDVTPWVVLLIGMVLSGMLYNRGKKK